MLPYINIPFWYAAGKLGASTDELKLIFTFLLSYPLAAVLKRIPDSKPVYKNLFIIGFVALNSLEFFRGRSEISLRVSFFYLVGLFDLWLGVRTIAISAIGAYSIASYVQGPFMPWIGFVFLMGHLSINQLQRQFLNDPGIIDITGAQMVMVMKLSAFCWNVADGRLPDKDLSDYQKDRSLKQPPNLLDYAGYVFFFPSLMAGPAFDFVDYRRWLETTMFEVPAGIDASKKPPTRKKHRIPRSGTPAAWKAAAGLFWILVFLKFSVWYYPEFLTGSEYMKYGFFYRVWILHMLNLTTRLKYYGVWALTEGACILSGLGFKSFDPATGKVSWDRLQNVSPWGVESAQNTRAYLGNWNINTNNWLRNYIYLRVTPRGKKPGFRASLATFVTSAFWHGFYPGYYLTFILASFVQTIAKNCRRYFRPFFIDPVTSQPTQYKIYYDIFSYLVTQLVFSYITTPFVLLTLPASWLVWSRVYFYTIIGTVSATAFFASPAKPWLKRKLDERAAKAGASNKNGHEQEGLAGEQPVMGLPPESLDDAINEIKMEMEVRQRKGPNRSTTLLA